MQRRTFVKAIAASLLVPSWVFTPRRVQHIDLSLFCCDEMTPKYDMTLPYLQGNLTYATDSRVCVRTSLISAPPVDATETRLPPTDALPWWDHDQLRGWKSLRTAPRVLREGEWSESQCPVCFRRGRIGFGVRRCSAPGCYGGYVTNGYDYEKPCTACRTTGYEGGSACPECGGSGEVTYAIQAGDTRLAPAYVAKLLTLGDVEYCGNDAGKDLPPVRLRFDGGEGLLCVLVDR